MGGYKTVQNDSYEQNWYDTKYKALAKRQLQGLIKQREKTVVTIFPLANTQSLSGLLGKSPIYRSLCVVPQ